MYPPVTVSIPLYKCEDYIIRCLDSVRMQTYPNLEVTLINDQTPDSSVRLAADFIAKHQLTDWKIYHLEENSGLSVVRNKGIDTANGKYLFFLDSDDTVTPDCIEKMTGVAEKEQVQMVVGEVVGIRENSEPFDVFPLRLPEGVIKGNHKIFKAFTDGDYPVSSWNKLIRTDFLKQNNLYFVAGLYAQDSLHSFQMAEKLETMAVIREKTYHYYLHKDSVIHNRGKKHFDNWTTIIFYMNKALQDASDERRRMIKEYIINYKSMTLVMNWKARKNKELWMYSHKRYKETANLSFWEYFSTDFSSDLKKKSLKLSLPTPLAFKMFQRSYNP